MPHPGLEVFKLAFRGESDMINTEFIEKVSKFVPLMLSSENIEPKKIGGHAITGQSLKEYLTKLSGISQTHKFPDVRTITAATVEVRYSLALKHAINLYYKRIHDFIVEVLPTDEQLCGYHRIVEDECSEYFRNEPKGWISEESKAEKIEELHIRIGLIFQVFQANNATRIDREVSEEKLNDAIAEQQEMRNRLDEQQRETDIKLNELKNEMLNAKEEAKIKEIEKQMHAMEERDKIQRQITEHNLEYLQRIRDNHQKYANEKIARERQNNANMQETLDQLRRPEFKLLGTSAVKDNLSLIKTCLSLYEQKLISKLETNPSDIELNASHQQVVRETLEDIATDQKFNNTVKEEISEILRKCFYQLFKSFRESNLARIEKEKSETNIRSNIAEQNRVKQMIDEHQTEMDRKLSELRAEITRVKEDTKVRELEKQIQLAEKNAVIQQSLMQKSVDYLSKIINFELNKAKEKQEIVDLCKKRRTNFKEMLKNVTINSNNNDDLYELYLKEFGRIASQAIPFVLYYLRTRFAQN